MNSVNLIFQNGHFYNRDTKKRVLFKEGKEYHIVSSADDFIEAPTAGRLPRHHLGTKELMHEIRNKKPLLEFHKIMEAGDILFFKIKRDQTYTFKVQIKEDLYLTKEKGIKEEYSLYDCQSETINNEEKNLEFFEPVYGKSLNDVRKCTYVHYFGNKGNPAANVFNDFMLPDMKTTLADIRNKYY